MPLGYLFKNMGPPPLIDPQNIKPATVPCVTGIPPCFRDTGATALLVKTTKNLLWEPL